MWLSSPRRWQVQAIKIIPSQLEWKILGSWLNGKIHHLTSKRWQLFWKTIKDWVCVCVFCIERRIGICEYARCFRALSQMIARKWGYSLICCLFPMFRWLFARYQPTGKGCSQLLTPNAIGWDPRSHKLPIRRGFLCDFYGSMVGKKCLESSRGTSWL